MQDKTKVILKSGKDEAIKRMHPWVFSGAIKKIYGPHPDGRLVEVFSNKDEYLGAGLFQNASIAVRVMAFSPKRPDVFDLHFWKEKLLKAYALRKTLGLTNSTHTNTYRLIHGEGDNLPGLIIDHYNGSLVIQAHAVGIHMHIDAIAQALEAIYGNQLKSIYYKSSDTLPSGFASEEETQKFLVGNTRLDVVREYGYNFEIDFIDGQKTGFFIDQRENRHLVTNYSKGRKVLNTFCYSGGFSVYAIGAEAASVDSLDSSAKAIELTKRNVEINFPQTQNHQTIVSDTLRYIRETDITYDLIILDPPAYAKHTNVRHNAVQGYKRLNAEALKKIAPGGILFTFSCSQVINMGLFKSTVISAAIQAGRQVKILHQLSQPADHPVNAFHPEGEYLKGLVLYVEDN